MITPGSSVVRNTNLELGLVMRALVDAIWVFIGLGVTEAIVKPIAKRWVQRRVIKAAPVVLEKVDSILPELIKLQDAVSVEAKVREIAQELTGENWDNVNIDPLFELFDLRKAVSKKR